MSVPRSPKDLSLGFRHWREGQREAIAWCLDQDVTHVGLQAPTGFGKSGIAGSLVQLAGRRGVTLTATKGLMDQYTETMPWLTDVRGAANYECLAARDEHARYFPRRMKSRPTCADGPCKVDLPCSLRQDGCLHFDAHRAAVRSPHVITNYAYWLSTRRHGQGIGQTDVLICDEAHAVADQLMKAFRIDWPMRRGHPKRPKRLGHWRDFALAELQSIESEPPEFRRDLHVRRTIETLTQLTRIDEGWEIEETAHGFGFEPVSPRSLLRLLTKGIDKVIYLSATVTDASLKLLGIRNADRAFRSEDSPFPVDRRPVYVIPTVRVDARSWSRDAEGYWIATIDRILRERLDRKALIATVSYDRARTIVRESRYRLDMHTHYGSEDLGDAIRRFREAKPPAIFVSPSVTTGWDFPYEDCEVVIVAKVPFPDTRSPIVKARVKALPGYRDHLTMQTIVQTSGRGMRAADDQCETFIIDDHFNWFYRGQGGDYAPQWFHDAVQFTRRIPAPPPPLSGR